MGRLTLELGLEGRFNGRTDYWREVQRDYDKASESLLEEEFQNVLGIIRRKYGLNSENGDKSSIDIILDGTYRTRIPIDDSNFALNLKKNFRNCIFLVRISGHVRLRHSDVIKFSQCILVIFRKLHQKYTRTTGNDWK